MAMRKVPSLFGVEDGSPEGALRFVIDPLSLTRIDRLQQGWRVVAVNRRG
jgi:alpha-ribazole phosphatase